MERVTSKTVRGVSNSNPDVVLHNYTIDIPLHASRFLKEICTGTFDVYKTNGDGACAIHSVFGVPSQDREYKCKEARQLFYESLGNTYSVFQSKLEENSQLLDRWRRNVWLEMVVPCIKTNFMEWLLPMGTDNEVKKFCKTLARDPAVCKEIMDLYRESEDLRAAFNTAREDLARRFGACCRLGSAAGFVDPLLDKLGRLHEFRSENKYHVLFETGPAAFRYHKSVVETLGANHFDEFYSIVSDVLEDIEQDRSAQIDCMDEVEVLQTELYDIYMNFEEHFKDPDEHIRRAPHKFYSAYVQTVRDNVDYWLSDIELLCLCACRRQSVVILKHEANAGSFKYQDSVIFDGAAVAFTVFGVQPGEARIRTHFEKVKRSPIADEEHGGMSNSSPHDDEHSERPPASLSDEA